MTLGRRPGVSSVTSAVIRRGSLIRLSTASLSTDTEPKGSLRDLALRGRILRASKNNDLKEAMQFFAEANERKLVLDMRSFVVLLSACVHPLQRSGNHIAPATAHVCKKHAMAVYESLILSGQPPSMDIFNLVSKTLAAAFDHEGAVRLTDDVAKYGLKPSTLFRANIVQAHGRGNVALAFELYGSMKEDGVRVSLIFLYCMILPALTVLSINISIELRGMLGCTQL